MIVATVISTLGEEVSFQSLNKRSYPSCGYYHTKDGNFVKMQYSEKCITDQELLKKQTEEAKKAEEAKKKASEPQNIIDVAKENNKKNLLIPGEVKFYNDCAFLESTIQMSMLQFMNKYEFSSSRTEVGQYQIFRAKRKSNIGIPILDSIDQFDKIQIFMSDCNGLVTKFWVKKSTFPDIIVYRLIENESKDG